MSDETYIAILEFLYTKDGVHKSKNEWREALIKLMKEHRYGQKS